jgi:hypothetical protein
VNEFDDEETGISQYSSQTTGALAEWNICTGVKSRISWFNSTGHHQCGFDVTGNRTVSNTVDLSSNLRTRAKEFIKIKFFKDEKEFTFHNESERANGAMAPEFSNGTK